MAPTHFRIATLRIFCLTKTRVTLHTPMPAEHDDDEADQAQIVLGPLHVFGDVVLGRAVGPGAGELVAKIRAEPLRVSASTPLSVDPQQDLVARPAAEGQQPGLRQVVVDP